MSCKSILLPLLLERVGERRIKSTIYTPSSHPSPSREKEQALVYTKGDGDKSYNPCPFH